MPKKQKYRIHNWKEYNKALVNRGSLTVWFDKSSMSSWYNDINNSVNASRGRPQVYSDLAIECCLTLKTVFKLPLRATQGFVDSLIKIMKIPIKSPHYSLLSIRQKEINLTMNKVLNSENREKMHVVIDSTGLKIYGEGEWKIKKHGKEKRRSWLKLHLAIDEKSHSIISHVITGSNTHDCEVLSELLEKIEGDICQVTGDGAYDTYNSYRLAIEKGATPCFPPRVTAVTPAVEEPPIL